jgi:hypothetical protein
MVLFIVYLVIWLPANIWRAASLSIVHKKSSPVGAAFNYVLSDYYILRATYTVKAFGL